MSTGWGIALVVVLVAVGALLAAAEAATSTISHLRAEALRRDGRRHADRLLRVAAEPARYLSTATLVRVVVEVAATVVLVEVLDGVVGPVWAAVLIAVAVMSVVLYVVGGVGPRTLGVQHAEAVALAGSGPLLVLEAVLGPVPGLLILLGNAVTPGRGFRHGPFATEARLRELVDLAEEDSAIEAGERTMIHRVFDLGDTSVREVMVPRTDIVWIERGSTLRSVESVALRSGFSRIPVLGDGFDDVVGTCYLKDVTRRVFDDPAAAEQPVESVMRPAVFVPDSKPADDLLRDMQAQRTHLALVVDEYGGTAGLVTIEDVLEEIVGEITDEYDTAALEPERFADGSVRVPSRMTLDDLGDLLRRPLDDPDVDTVGGLLSKGLGTVPIPGDRTRIAGLELVADSTGGRRNRIGSVVVTPLEPEEPSSGDGTDTDTDTDNHSNTNNHTDAGGDADGRPAAPEVSAAEPARAGSAGQQRP